MAKAKSERKFRVLRAFSAETESGRVWITRGNQDQVGGLLSTKQLDAALKSGSLAEIGKTEAVPGEPLGAPSPAERQAAEEETR